MTAVIDVEGYRLSDGTFVIKELAYCNLNCSETFHGIYRAPYEFSQLNARDRHQVKWLTHNLHNLAWERGDLPFRTLETTLKDFVKKFNVVYAKGYSKCQMLEKQYGLEVIDLDCILCPNVTDLPETSQHCSHHYGMRKHCALAKAQAYAKWLKD